MSPDCAILKCAPMKTVSSAVISIGTGNMRCLAYFSLKRHVDDRPNELPIIKRKRRQRGGFSGSSFRQRDALEHIADDPELSGGPLAEPLRTGTRGAVLVHFAADTGGRGVRPAVLPAPPDDAGAAAAPFAWALPS